MVGESSNTQLRGLLLYELCVDVDDGGQLGRVAALDQASMKVAGALDPDDAVAELLHAHVAVAHLQVSSEAAAPAACTTISTSTS